jgi:SAM-dependent methyltransferase
MLAQAQKKEHAGHVHFVRARAEVLPLAAGSVDVVFMSMAFHHFSDRDRAAGECRRVLRRGGRVLVRTGTREQISAYPYYPFFPPSHAIMREVLPDCATFRNVFEGAGLILSAQEVITQTVAPDWDVYADKLATRADSVLVQLDASEFERGLAAVRQHAASSAGEAVIEPIDLFVFRA